MNWGMTGGIIGGVLGLLGGLLGACFSIRNTKSRRERTFVLRGTLIAFLIVGIYVAIVLMDPKSLVWIWLPYTLILTFGITYFNKKQLAIRRSERQTETDN